MHHGSFTRTKVLKLRLKDKHSKFLNLLAREVNFVCNYCNELQVTMFNRERRVFSGYDFAKFTRGATREGLQLHSQSVQAIAEEFATRRRQCGKVRLTWRKSGGSRRSLGWIPFKAAAIRAEIDEAFSTQVCSACSACSGPRGIAGIGVRAWTCSECGTVHDRDLNAAKNILAAGRRHLAEGIPAL